MNQAHRAWLKLQEMNPVNRTILDEYLVTLADLEEKADRFDAVITKISETEKYKRIVDALICFKEIMRASRRESLRKLAILTAFQQPENLHFILD